MNFEERERWKQKEKLQQSLEGSICSYLLRIKSTGIVLSVRETISFVNTCLLNGRDWKIFTSLFLCLFDIVFQVLFPSPRFTVVSPSLHMSSVRMSDTQVRAYKLRAWVLNLGCIAESPGNCTSQRVWLNWFAEWHRHENF